MMKVALWGYGKYGRRMFESLTLLCSDKYEVVRVYDRDYQKLQYTEGKIPLPIHNPEELVEDYRKGIFEKVLLCFLWYEVLIKPREFLIKHSIPELHLGSEDDFYSASCFEQGTSQLRPHQKVRIPPRRLRAHPQAQHQALHLPAAVICVMPFSPSCPAPPGQLLFIQ